MSRRSLESAFQKKLKDELRELLPGCIILKNDSSQLQGIPDLLILWEDRWAVLEVKRSEKDARQPNQEYYIDELNAMSYASFIWPENKEVVIDEILRAFGITGTPRISKRK